MEIIVPALNAFARAEKDKVGTTPSTLCELRGSYEMIRF